jgi:hypothetical protein
MIAASTLIAGDRQGCVAITAGEDDSAANAQIM